MDKVSGSYLSVSWPACDVANLSNVHAVTTLRSGGVSSGDFSAFNLAGHVGDDSRAVKANRKKLVKDLQLPAEPVWLEQVHSNTVICADDIFPDSGLQKPLQEKTFQADASFSRNKGVVCTVMTADCLPVFICNNSGTEIAVAHAGWRGLHAGIISNTVAAMRSQPEELLVALGPAIGPAVFEVGEEVFSAFVNKNDTNESAFVSNTPGHYLCDIYQLARNELISLGVNKVSGGDHCTYREDSLFYSFRKQKITGRMASLIWMT